MISEVSLDTMSISFSGIPFHFARLLLNIERTALSKAEILAVLYKEH
jgi:hypothetical protein